MICKKSEIVYVWFISISHKQLNFNILVKSVYTCGSGSNGATTNFVNPSYPKSDTTAGGSRVSNSVCTFLLKIPSGNEDICQVSMLYS